MVISSHSRRTPRNWLSRIVVLVLLIGILVTVRLVEDIGPDQAETTRFQVVNVIDGDTFEMTGGDRLRLLAIDTPEKGEPLCNEATAYLSSLVLGKTVQVEFSGRRRDGYGRLLGFVYVDQTLINEAMLERGLANLYLFKDSDLDNPLIGRMLQTQRSAMKREIGIWALEKAPEYFYVSTPGSFRFHRPACPSVSHLRADEYIRYEIRQQAMARGLSPCRNCKP